ncbi:uncharacterized protein N7498_004689 [Penicillium cinerascens]|uniref:Uncharacterized protein n=1 Tax=Penicillium cinerascens TaxID=70096 RepID=A0A9W9SZV6_9EURO|nr:uncharacterized protein N7498_004689 [Penicillium cinerascens]KAJ5203810.1 hypothetical protein N7498_004689 [Penicillium cinerascens]
MARRLPRCLISNFIRGLSSRELVERAERQKVTTTRQKKSAALAKGAAFITARKLLLGDVTIVVNSAAGEELLLKGIWARFRGLRAVVGRRGVPRSYKIDEANPGDDN